MAPMHGSQLLIERNPEGAEHLGRSRQHDGAKFKGRLQSQSRCNYDLGPRVGAKAQGRALQMIRPKHEANSRLGLIVVWS